MQRSDASETKGSGMGRWVLMLIALLFGLGVIYWLAPEGRPEPTLPEIAIAPTETAIPAASPTSEPTIAPEPTAVPTEAPVEPTEAPAATEAATEAPAATEASGSESGADLASAGDVTKGQQLASMCLACHSVNGADGVGPTWKGLYGSEVELEDGSTVVADDAYLAQSIVDPMSQIVKGYPPAMPPFAQMSDQDIADLIAYIKSLEG